MNRRIRGLAGMTVVLGSAAAAVAVPLDISRLKGGAEAAGPSSRRTGVVISEIMYHPADRPDGRNTEFIELFNPQPVAEDLTGCRLSGELDFTFPSNTILAAGGYLVVAPDPDDVAYAYGLTGVMGGTSNRLANNGGRVRLRDEMGAVWIEVNYDDPPPWPVAADGAGHSLVLARPSYGEGDPRAWGPSEAMGGSPGAAEPTAGAHPSRTVMFNELLAHTDAPEVDFIELFNYGTNSVDLGGCVLSDDPITNRFVIPAGTTIPGLGHVAFTGSQLGFNMNAAGETIYLREPGGGRVVDALRWDAQENGVSTGRSPDGSPEWSRLADKTPGAANGARRVADVVINELMYHPVTEEEGDEYVELYNRGAVAVDLTRWRLEDGIEYTFPSNAVIQPGGYLVVARDRARLLAGHPGLAEGRVLGDYDGSLSDRGERIALSFPDELVQTNALGRVETNKVQIVVDEVDYRDGGRWGRWADGGGSSLERIDPRADGRLASSWADSDEASKSAWTNIECTGVLDLGRPSATRFQMFLQGEGECLVDNVEVIGAAGTNLVANPTFDGGIAGWYAQGTHEKTGWCATEGFSGGRCLQIRADGRGNLAADRVYCALGATPAENSIATLRAKVRWLKGSPEILLRLKGNWLEAPGYILTTRDLGTPGTNNSRRVANAGPAIYNVRHAPILPAVGQAMTVSAQVHDPDGLSQVRLLYRYGADTSTAWPTLASYTAVTMSNCGAGFYSARVAAPASPGLVGFVVEATDAAGAPATTRFPADAPPRECLAWFGGPAHTGGFCTYRILINGATEARWRTREKNSNQPLDMTLIYNDTRAVYNGRTHYSGSVFHTGVYEGPMAPTQVCDYEVTLPTDDRLLGQEDFLLITPGNVQDSDIGTDTSLIREQVAFWMLRKLGAPYLHRRHAKVYVDGMRRAGLYEDVQQPNSDVIAEFYPNDTDGDFYKVDDWIEIYDSGDGLDSFSEEIQTARLLKYTTTGGAYKLARYRWMFRRRAAPQGAASDFDDLLELVETINLPGPEPLVTRMDDLIRESDWTKAQVINRMVGNWDSYGMWRGKNAYLYRPPGGRWTMIPWDIDMIMGSGSEPSNYPVAPEYREVPTKDDPALVTYRTQPPLARQWWRAMQHLADLMASPALSTLMMNKYNAIVAEGITPGQHWTTVLSWITQRRAYMVGELSRLTVPFAITTGGGADFTTNVNVVTLSGSAPVGVEGFLVNGVERPVTWTSVTNWTLQYVLSSPTNAISLQGVNEDGVPLPEAADTVTVRFTGVADAAAGSLVIHEIMYNPLVADAAYVEIRNVSPTTAFDLGGWRLDGVDFIFPTGTIMPADGYLTVVEDFDAFRSVYGTNAAIAGVYDGRLQKSGETLRLVRPGVPPDADEVIDEVTYDDDTPWPSLADGFGASLQLLNPALDNNRVANWGATGIAVKVDMPVVPTSTWRFYTNGYAGAAWMATNFSDASWRTGGALLYRESGSLPWPKTTQLRLGPTSYYFRTTFAYPYDPSAADIGMRTVIDDGAVIYLNGQDVRRLRMAGGMVWYTTLATQSVSDATVEGPFEVSASHLVQGTNVLAAEVHQYASTFTDMAFGLELTITNPVTFWYTPGYSNIASETLTGLPPVWLNEVQPANASGPTDRFGQRHAWLEMYNGGASAVSLAGWNLSDTYTNLTAWAFPPGAAIQPGQFVVVWLDGQPARTISNEWHTSFALSPTNAGSVVLSTTNGGRRVVVDYLNYAVLAADRSYGAYPDGAPANRRRFYYATPGSTNRIDAPAVELYINEWMANNSIIADPADGDFDDWFEIHNAGPSDVDLTGYTITDDLSVTNRYTVPAGTLLGAGDFLLVWADGETGQNGEMEGQIHADFGLKDGGEDLGIFDPDGRLVDGLVFGNQTENVSEGRYPDDSAAPFALFSVPTPGSSNVTAPNRAPTMGNLTDRTVREQEPLSFVATATDPDAGQSLVFILAGGHPAGAAVHPDSGVFTWTPGETDGSGVFTMTIRVIDEGTPALTDERTFTVQVEEVDSPPSLFAVGDVAAEEDWNLVFTLVAIDPDIPADVVKYRLDAAPPGATIDADSGLFQWTLGEEDGPGMYPVTVTAYEPGVPSMVDSITFNVQVAELNRAPHLDTLADQVVWAGMGLALTNRATDPDLPANALTFSLPAGAPAGATVDAGSGVFAWTPPAESAGTTNAITVRVADDGAPVLSAERTFRVIVPATGFVFTRVGPTTNGTVALEWAARPGRSYRLEALDEMGGSTWVFIAQVQCTNAPVNLSIPIEDRPRRFYRVREE